LPPKPPELDLSKVRLSKMASRPSKVGVGDFGRPCPPGSSFKTFVGSLPSILAGKDIREAAERIALAVRGGKAVMLAMGGHPVKVGLGPLIVRLMEAGAVTSLSGNGSVMVHDLEAALFGATSEDVDETLGDGSFGVTDETGSLINRAAREAAQSGEGLGWALGRILGAMAAPNKNISVLHEARRLNVPLTVHPAVGTDVFNIHPEADGAALGKAAMDDFRTFCSLVASLEGGVFINLGSAVIMPEVFLKALTLARNLGFRQAGLTTIDMDFIRQHRPRVNVCRRPVMESGRGFSFTGHHEVMFPLLMAMVMELLDEEGGQ
jgi:hypothetical protein